MQLTVRELQKWLIELPGDFVVTLTDEYINATNPDSDTYDGAAIWIGTDEVTELC